MEINKETGEISYAGELTKAYFGVFARTPYNYDTNKVSDETGTDTGPETKTQQQFKDEVDINTIVERFGVTGQMPPMQEFPTEQDFGDAFDFQTSMNVIVAARESFMQMPAKQRARFNNDPQQFMEFIHDGNNADEAMKMGLAIKRPEPEKKPEEPVKKEEKKE